MRGLVVWCMLRAFDSSLPAAAAVSTLVLVTLSIAAIAAPGNVGVFELSAAGALALWGIAAERGVSFSLGRHAAEVVPTAVLGTIAVLTLPAGIRQDRTDRQNPGTTLPARSDERAPR